jgi:flagellar basal-body rod modification protein FlgD
MATTNNAITNTRSAADVYASLNTTSNYAGSKTNEATEQQARFLKLLTAQLKNQDPLAPMDNTQMTSQLAQISTVDGIERMNMTLKSLSDGTQSAQSVQAAALLGKGVLVPGDKMQLKSGAAVAGIELPTAVDSLVVEIRNANGLLVNTVDLGKKDAGVHGFAWDGKTDSGAQAVDGTYSFLVTAKADKTAVSSTKLTYGTVAGVANTTAGTKVSINGLGDYLTSDIRRIM